MSKRTISKLAALLVFCLALVMSGCGKPWQDPGPDGAFENFLLDLYMGKRQSAFESLRKEDRDRLTKALDALEGDVSEDALPEKSQMLVTGRVDNPYDLKDIEHDHDLSTEPDKGTVVELELVYHDGRTGEAQVIWGGDRWYVDLPDAVNTAEKPEPDPHTEKVREEGAAHARALVEQVKAHIRQVEAEAGSDGAGKPRTQSGDQ